MGGTKTGIMYLCYQWYRNGWLLLDFAIALRVNSSTNRCLNPKKGRLQARFFR